MPRAFRFSIARLMGVVIIAAIGVAALRQSTEAWAGTMLLIALGAIAIALAGAFSREPARPGIDRDDIPEAEALRLCLDPAGRTYLIRPGYLQIVLDTTAQSPSTRTPPSSPGIAPWPSSWPPSAPSPARPSARV